MDMHAFFSFIPRPLRLAIFGAAVSVILYLTLAPTNDVPGAKLVWDKAAHAIAFGLLVVIGLLMSTHRRKTVIVCVWGLAAGIEVSLWLTGDATFMAVPGRAELVDLPDAVPLAELRDLLLDGATVTVCGQCAARRGLTVDDLSSGAGIRGAAAFVEEVMAPGARSLVY